LRQGGAADGLKDNRVGTILWSALNGAEKLRALRDRVVIGVDYLQFDI